MNKTTCDIEQDFYRFYFQLEALKEPCVTLIS